MQYSRRFSIGLVINPFAGIGGAVALKGSDGEQTREKALALGASPKANQRVTTALQQLQHLTDELQFVTAAGAMGADVLASLGFAHEVVYQPQAQQTEATDTQAAIKAIQQHNPDLIVFAGGDGTARDVYTVIHSEQLVLGIPAGVKIHSGVYSISPKAAARVIENMVSGGLSSVRYADVMDIDEHLFRQGTVKAKRFGEMLVPDELQYIQAVKMGGKESDELVLADLAAEIEERLDDEYLIVGSGSTINAIMEEMGLSNTLLGVDWVHDGDVLAQDLTEAELYQRVTQIPPGQVKLLVTVIGGQGHVIGRGNQQLSPRVLEAVGRENLWIVATKNKLNGLEGRPLRIDSGDEALDHAWSGMISVITGYHDEVVVRIEAVD
ncbi:ATP-NAD kinase [Idiomarina sp. MD25a]|uniref:ATP-NAD kinase family protein n=1 Tax=Idiomarina sp. MD25a TaxID=1889913 RepID=UPI0008F84DC7|nr:ATP-NAD kinase family protein [Idiomarina sp. MD25a]OIM99883.1 ATP-NAD kinase [Idiomarina sp. MD25a]